MKLLILLLILLASLLYARETELTYEESSLFHTSSKQKLLLNYSYLFKPHLFKETVQSEFSQALLALKPKREAFKVDYGNGVLTNKLEEATLVLLDYQWIANIVYTLSDDFKSNRPKRRARVLLNVNNNEFKFCYSF